MKKIKINLALILLILICNVSYAQHSDVEHMYFDAKSLTSIDLRSKKLMGTSYINEEFLPAKISNNEIFNLIRYNAYLDEMEVEIGGKAFYLPKTTIYSINFVGSNKEYLIANYNESGIEKRGFFVLLTSGDNVTLLKQEKIKLYEEVPAKLGFTQYEPPKLGRLKDKYFIGYKNNTTVELPKKKKDFLVRAPSPLALIRKTLSRDAFLVNPEAKFK